MMKISLNTSLAAILFAILIAGCSSLGTDSELEHDDPFFENAKAVKKSTVADGFVTIKQSQQGSYKFDEKSNKVINDSESFEALWEDIHANKTSLPELPKVDFTKYTVVAAMMGVQSSGGYSIEISEIAEDYNTVGVKIKEKEPGSSCVTTSVLTSPFHIVKIPKNSGIDFRFTTDRMVSECES